jgi:hypothetical protein
MYKFKVDFEYFIPETSEITLDAEDALDAQELAVKEIERMYPEAVDIEMIKVTEL